MLSGKVYSIPSDQIVEIKTTGNIVNSYIQVHYDTRYFLFQYFSTGWKYVIPECMENSWATNQYMSIPGDYTKVWKIQKTGTALILVCNDVTVLNFNFASHYRNGFSNCHNYWTAQSTTILFAFVAWNDIFISREGENLIQSWSLKFPTFTKDNDTSCQRRFGYS